MNEPRTSEGSSRSERTERYLDLLSSYTDEELAAKYVDLEDDREKLATAALNFWVTRYLVEESITGGVLDQTMEGHNALVERFEDAEAQLYKLLEGPIRATLDEAVRA